jgi:hypothetical protein
VPGTADGALKRIAARVGLAPGAYADRVRAGEKYCWRCRGLHPRAAFNVDATRSDGLASECRDSHNAAAKAKYEPRPRRSKLGAFFAPAREGDKRQARSRVNHHVDVGLLPDPNDVPCTDCGHVYVEGGRRHEYDHHLGYSAKHQLDVEAVCTSCHHGREANRRG